MRKVHMKSWLAYLLQFLQTFPEQPIDNHREVLKYVNQISWLSTKNV